MVNINPHTLMLIFCLILFAYLAGMALVYYTVSGFQNVFEGIRGLFRALTSTPYYRHEKHVYREGCPECLKHFQKTAGIKPGRGIYKKGSVVIR